MTSSGFIDSSGQHDRITQRTAEQRLHNLVHRFTQDELLAVFLLYQEDPHQALGVPQKLLAYRWPDTAPPVIQYSFVGFLLKWLSDQRLQQFGFHLFSLDQLLMQVLVPQGYEWADGRTDTKVQFVEKAASLWAEAENDEMHFTRDDCRLRLQALHIAIERAGEWELFATHLET